MNIKTIVSNFINKYKTTVFCVFVLGLLITFRDEYFHFKIFDIFNTKWEFLWLVSEISLSTYLVCKIYGLYTEYHSKIVLENTKNPLSKVKISVPISKILLYFAFVSIIILLHIYYRIFIFEKNTYNIFDYKFTFTMPIMTFMVMLINIKQKSMSLKEYLLKIFLNTIILFVFYIIVIAGITILFFVYKALFNSVDWEIYMKIATFVSTLIFYIGLLIAFENVIGEFVTFSKILIKYVMFIMVLIGFAFFYIYLVQIIITKEIPSNQVFVVCMLLFSIGLLVALMSSIFTDDTIYFKIIKYLPLFFTPALIMQIISISLRIGQYGLTTDRYLGICVIIFEISYIIVYFLKNNKLHILLLELMMLFFIIVYAPYLNIIKFPKIYNEIMKIDERQGLEAKEKIVETNLWYAYDDVEYFDVSDYNKVYNEVYINLRYNEKSKTYNLETNNGSNIENVDFSSIKFSTARGKILTETIDLSEYLSKIEESIIENDYTTDDDIILKNIDNEIIVDNIKFIVKYLSIRYIKDIGFKRINIRGPLCVK